jgi:hypothetical protein
MLEFFRRAGTSPEPEAPGAPRLEPTTRMIVVRRSQAVVAAMIAAAALLLVFLLGHAVGAAGGSDAAANVYVIRAAAYGDDEQGRTFARSVKEQLEKMDLGEEVGVVRVAGENRTVVTVGAWLADPAGRKEARALRDKLRAIKELANADFWRMGR